MPQPATTKSDKVRGDRTVVGISDADARLIDELIAKAGETTTETLGYAVEPSRSQVVTQLVRGAHRKMTETAASA